MPRAWAVRERQGMGFRRRRRLAGFLWVCALWALKPRLGTHLISDLSPCHCAYRYRYRQMCAFLLHTPTPLPSLGLPSHPVRQSLCPGSLHSKRLMAAGSSSCQNPDPSTHAHAAAAAHQPINSADPLPITLPAPTPHGSCHGFGEEMINCAFGSFKGQFRG